MCETVEKHGSLWTEPRTSRRLFKSPADQSTVAIITRTKSKAGGLERVRECSPCQTVRATIPGSSSGRGRRLRASTPESLPFPAMDPLASASAAYSNSPNPNLSPLAPRPPLPGERTGHYRPQPLPPPPSTSAWGSPPTTPQLNGNGSSSGSGAQWADAPRRAGSGSGLTPRSPQSRSSRERERDADEDDHDYDPTRTQGGGVAQLARPPPQDGFVRIKIVGLDKNRRDVYLKFNAEVRSASHLHAPWLTPSTRRATCPPFATRPVRDA